MSLKGVATMREDISDYFAVDDSRVGVVSNDDISATDIFVQTARLIKSHERRENKFGVRRLHPTIRYGRSFEKYVQPWLQNGSLARPIRAASFFTMVLNYPFRPLFGASRVVECCLIHHEMGLFSVYPMAANLTEVQFDRPIATNICRLEVPRAIIALGLLGVENVPRSERGIVGVVE